MFDPAPDLPTTTITSAADWTYLAEGGATLVCSYRGAPHAAFSGKVLRLRKAPRRTGSGPSRQINAVSDLAEFQRDIIFHLLPPPVVLPRLELVYVDAGCLQELADGTEAYRPAGRRVVDGIDTGATTALLAEDLISGHAVVVEIKPKWGFLPEPTYLSPETARVKTQYCRYCMHKYLKASKVPSRRVPISRYCPLDLYSTTEPRMRKALGDLWDDWVATAGSTNNFRVFAEGQLIEPNDERAMLQLASAIGASLDAQSDVKEGLADRVLLALSQSLTLSTLGSLQRTLDPLDIEGLSALHRSIYPSAPLGFGQTQPDIREWKSFLESYLSGNIPSSAEEKLRYYILAYMLSATFKDCSIIVRLPLRGNEGAPGGVYVIDLGPKPVERLPKWEALDREIVQTFSKVELTAPCVEEWSQTRQALP